MNEDTGKSDGSVGLEAKDDHLKDDQKPTSR